MSEKKRLSGRLVCLPDHDEVHSAFATLHQMIFDALVGHGERRSEAYTNAILDSIFNPQTDWVFGVLARGIEEMNDKSNDAYVDRLKSMTCKICQNHEATARVDPEFVHSRTLRGLIEGLEILAKYVEHSSDDDRYSFRNDAVFTGPGSSSEMSEKDKAQLDQLGWAWDEEDDCWRKWS